MILVALTDIHGKPQAAHDIAHDLKAADVVLLPGDLTMFGRRDDALRVLDAVRKHNPRVLAVMGNCDFPEVEELLTEEGINLHRGNKTLDGVTFVGLGGSLPCPIPTLNEWTESEIADHLEAAYEGVGPAQTVVLVSHQPPSDTVVDLAGIGKHVGSAAVRHCIERHRPAICFSGHIHEAQGTDAIGGTVLINPGPFLEGHYAWVELDEDGCRTEIRCAPASALR